MTAVGDRTRALVAPASATDRGGRPGRGPRRPGGRGWHRWWPRCPRFIPVVDLPLLRRRRSHPERLVAPEEPFAWRPAFVRRSLGLAVVEACARGRFRSPLEAAAPVLSEAVGRWEETGWRTFHWEPWVAGLAPGARAVVLAEAVGWASSLWSSFDWSAFGPRPEFGGRRRPVDVSRGAPVRLASQAGAPSARVAVGRECWRPGGRWPWCRSPAGARRKPGGRSWPILALVSTLRSPTRPVPARVLGWWPDAGADRSVEIDLGSLTGSADRVVATVSAVVAARCPVADDDRCPEASEEGLRRFGVGFARRGQRDPVHHQ